MDVRHVCALGLMIVLMFGPSFTDESTGVVMDMEPKFVYPEVTQSVTLTCTLNSPDVAGQSLDVFLIQIKKSAAQTKEQEKTSTGNKDYTKKQGDQTNAEILLAGVNFREGAKVHVEQDDDDDKRLEVEGDLQKRTLVLTIHRPGLKDLGHYTCHVSAMAPDYHIVLLAASANLSIIGEEGSTVLLLAQQEALKLKQEGAERERLVLEEKAHRLQKAQDELGATVRTLEEKIQRLNDQILKLLDSHPLEGDLHALSAPSTDHGQQTAMAPAVLQALSKRMDILEKKTVEEISQQVTQLKNVEVKGLRERLDRLEGHRLSEMEVRLTKVQALEENNKQHIEEVETNVLNDLKTECYVCGSWEKSKHCSTDELTELATIKCPLDAGFCMNDIVQTADGLRQIYKRCVSREDCVQQGHTSSQRCEQFNILTSGPLTCHFCCSSGRCNLKMKPDELYRP